jgi:outer membrane protein assembly factor BamB
VCRAGVPGGPHRKAGPEMSLWYSRPGAGIAVGCPQWGSTRARMAAAGVAIALSVLIPTLGAPTAGARGLASSPWPMFLHDPQHTGRSPNTAPSQTARKWRVRLTGQPASPAIGPGGIIYVPTGAYSDDPAGYLYAINPNGTVRWRYRFPSSAGCVIVPGITTPAVASGGTIFVHTESGQTVDGTSQCTAGPSFLYAINPDGTKKWRYQLNGGSAVFQGSGISSPAIGTDGTIYLTSADTGLYAIHPNGTLYWAVSPEGTSLASSPALGTDGTIYVISAHLYAYAPNGAFKWATTIGSGVPNDRSPSIAPSGRIYACSIFPNECYATTPAGSVPWSFPVEADNFTTPVLGANGPIYVTSSDGDLFALNPNGSQKWHKHYQSQVDHSVIVGGNGKLYARTDIELGGPGFIGRLSILNADGTLSGTTLIPPSQSSSDGELNPAIGANGTLYVPQPHHEVGVTYDPHDQYLAAYVQRTASRP